MRQSPTPLKSEQARITGQQVISDRLWLFVLCPRGFDVPAYVRNVHFRAVMPAQSLNASGFPPLTTVGYTRPRPL